MHKDILELFINEILAEKKIEDTPENRLKVELFIYEDLDLIELLDAVKPSQNKGDNDNTY